MDKDSLQYYYHLLSIYKRKRTQLRITNISYQSPNGRGHMAVLLTSIDLQTTEDTLQYYYYLLLIYKRKRTHRCITYNLYQSTNGRGLIALLLTLPINIPTEDDTSQ